TEEVAPVVVTDSGRVAIAEPPSIVGVWTVVKSENVLEGELTLNEDGSFSKMEMHKDSVRAGMEGKYLFDNTQQPFAIDICLGECGAPGSEWTTTHGILRFLNADRIEIRWSDTDKRPTEFAAEPDYNTVILVRKVMEETEKE
ncbi:MAG: hypothetical protein ABIJ61_12325, partial [bacterium]